MMNKFCPNISLPESKALIEELGLLGFYKHYIKNGYSINEDIEDSTSSVSDLLFINKDKFSAYQQSETIKSLIFQIQTYRKEGMNNAKDIINQIKSDFTETEAYWRNPTDFPGDEVTTQIADNIKNVLTHFDDFVIRANTELEKNGLRTSGVSIVTEDTSVQTDNDVVESSYDSTDASYQKLNYDDESSFSQSSKDTASGDIKVALSLIPKYVYEKGKLSIDDNGDPEAELNHLYLPKFEDLDAIWKDLLYTLVDVPVGEKLNYLKNSSNPRHQVVYQEIVSNPSTNIQNEFEVVFSKQQANFVTVNIAKPDASGSKTIGVFDTNRSNASSFLIDNWYEQFLQSGIIKTDSNGDRYVDSKLGASAKQAFANNRDLLKTNPTKAVSNIVGILNSLGINISEKAFNETIRDENGKSITGSEVINSKLPYFFERLSGSVTEQELEDSLEYNNPFINDTSSITLLAKLENKANPTLFEDSFISGDGKSKYSFVNNTYLSHKIRKLKTDDKYLSDLKKTPYASQSYWLNQLISNPSFRDNFNIFYTDTLGNDKTNQTNKPFRRMSTKEKEFSRIALFQNQGRGVDSKSSNIGYFIGLIPSDKTTIPIFKTLKVNVRTDTDLRFNQDTIDVMYDQFISEYNRIKQTKLQNEDESVQKIAGYHGKNGAGNKFIVFRFLNKDLIVNNELLELDDIRLAEIVRPKIENFLADLTQQQIDYWKSLDLYSEDILDKSYKSKKGITADPNKDSSIIEANLRQFAADYAVNQFIFMMNQTQLISGDPALHGKNDKTGAVSIDKTWVNFYKRMAKDIAPGLDGNFKNGSFNTIFLEDLKYDSALLNEYNEKVGEIAQAYVGMNPADAQEYTTLQEHLNVMDAYGRLTEEGKAAGQRLLDGGTDASDIALVLQPMKPVYVTDKIEDNIDKMYYIKTSSFPLIPALTSGLEIDKLRLAMEANQIDRAVYESGVKLGLQGSISNVSKDGFVKFRELNVTPDQIINLDRSGFRIQQELPYHGGDTHISEGSQARKLILNNLDDSDTITYNGNEMSGKAAKQLFEDLHTEKMNRAFTQFMDDIGFDESLGKITDLSKIEKILKEEATLRNYPINDVYSIQVVNENGRKRFKVPLGFTNNSSRFESILNALVTNRVIKQELPGFSKVQGSGAGFSKIAGFDEANSVVKSAIVWTDSKDTVLGYTKSSNGTLTGADILVPSWFKGIDIASYIKEDGTLDTDRLPESLLTLIGIRIPTQGYNSMMKFKVKGFLPKYMGDLAIVPSEIVVQMGSDFDVDKLFLYRYHYKKEDNGSLRRLILDTTDVSKLNNEQIEDSITQMFEDRLSDERLLDQMLEPNGFGTLPEVANTVAKLQTGDRSIHTFTTKDQNNIHKLNNDGKAGTGIFSLFSTFNKTAQDAKLSLKEPLSFKNNNGNIVTVGNLYNITGINGQNKSSVIAYLQSAAVDNAKEQILGKLNINDQTMGVAGTMAMLGLDEVFIGYFLAQPVLINYVNRIQQANDIITAEFDPTLETKTREALYKELLGDYDSALLNSIDDSIIYSSKQLLQFLEQGDDTGLTQLTSEELNAIGKVNNLFATKVLNDFVRFKSLADNIRVIQSAINTDTNGLGASYTALETKAQQVDSLLEQSGKESYPINNVANVFSNNIIGKATSILKQSKSIYAQILPQGSIAYNQAINKVQTSVGLILTDNNLNDIYRNIKSYILTSPDIIGDSIEQVRQELLYSDNNLAKRWLDYSKTAAGRKNILTSRIKPRFGKKKGDVNMLTALNTPASNNSIDIDNSIMFFYDMIENGTDIEKALANDLVRYYIVTGAQFGPSSIGKYISYDVLERNNFSEKLRRIEDDMDKGFILDGFIDQYFQNNPTKAKSYQLPKVVERFITKETPELVVEGQGMAGYFTYYDEKSSKFYLYKKIDKIADGFLYQQIPVLANTKQLIKNYNFNNITNISSSQEDKPNVKVPSKKESRTADERDTEASVKQAYNFDGGVENILKSIISNSKNSYYSKLASDLLSKMNNFGNIAVKASTNFPSNGWYGANTISVNFNTILSNFPTQANEKFEEVFLHELLHAGTVNSLEKFERLKNTKSNPSMVTDGDFTREQILAINGINNLYNEYVKNYPNQDQLNKYIDINNRRRNLASSITTEEMQFLKDNKAELYPLINVKEFVAAGLTAENFTSTLKQGNFWTKFVDFISNLLGINKSDLDALYNSTVSLLDTNSNKSNVSVYSELGNITASKNVIIKSVYQQEGVRYAKSIGGIFSLRINGTNRHFGNPFSSDNRLVEKDNLIKTNSTKESVEKYIDWVLNSSEERAIWIRDLINSGELKNKPIVYYKELGEPSHATALDYLINDYNEDFDVNQDELNRLTFVEQRDEFLRAYKKQIGSVMTPESLENIKKYADANSKYSNLRIWGWPTSNGKVELRVSRQDPIYEDIADAAPVKSESQLFIDRVLSKYRDNLQKLQDRQRQLGTSAPADLSVRIDNLKKQIANLIEKQSVTATIEAAQTKVNEINKALNNNTFNSSDLYEYKSYINMLIDLNQQITFDEGFEELTSKLNNVSAEAIKLNKKLREKEIETVQSWLTEDLDIPFDLRQKLESGLKDVGAAESGFLDYSQSSSEVIQSIGYLIDRARFEANQKHDDFAEEFTPLLKEYLDKYKNYNFLLQKDSNGKPTGFLLNKYSQEFYDKSKGNFKFFNNNTTVTYTENGKAQYEEDKKTAFDSMSEIDYFTWLRLNSPEVFINDWKGGKRSEAKGAEKYLSIKPSDKWLDTNYTNLKSLGEDDPAVKFYNFIEPIIRKTSRKYNQQSNYIPEIQKSTLDYFTSGNMKGGFSNINRALVDSLTVELNSGANQIDEFTGEIRPSIPVAMFANNLSAEDKSYDLARIVEAVQYQEYTLTAKREVEPLLNIYYNVLQDSKSIVTKPNGDEIVIDKPANRILDQSNYLIQSYLYNKSKEVEGVSDKKIDGKNIAASKATDSLINYVRIKGMAFNPFSAIGNIMQGLTSNFITSVGGEYFSTSDNFKAFGTMLHSIAGNTDTAKKIGTMLRKFDAFSKANELQFGSSRDIKSTQNPLNNLSWFELQQRGEYFIQGQTLTAMLYNKKVVVDGKEVSWFDGYDSKGKWKPEFGEDPLADKTAMYKFTQEVKSAVIDVHGNYVREIQNKKNFYWRAAMIFRTWLPQAINVRFGSETTDLLTGKVKKGRYRSYGAMLRDSEGKIDFTAFQSNILSLLSKSQVGQMTELDKINMRKNIAELALIAAISLVILGLKAALEDLDDDEKNYTTYVINSLSRSQSDLTFFMLPSSFETIIKDPIPLMGVLKDTIDLSQAAFSSITGDPVYKTGPRKGKSRFYKELVDNFPILNQLDKNLTYASEVFNK